MVKEMIKHQAYLDTGYHAKGRIKRMRTKKVYPFVDLTKRTRQKYADAFPRCYAPITRWNRH